MWRCSADSQTVLPYIIPIPASAGADRERDGVGAAREQRQRRDAELKPVSAAARIGRRGMLPDRRQRAEQRADAERGVDRRPRRRRRRARASATTGPSTLQAPKVTLHDDAHSTNVHTQVVPAERRPALAQVLPERWRPRATRPRHAHAEQQQRAGGEGRGVDGERPARADRGHEHAGQHRAADLARGHRGRADAVGLLEVLRRHDRGSSPVEAGLKKPVAIPVSPVSSAMLQTSADARDHQRREQALRHDPREVGADHHRPPRAPGRRRRRRTAGSTSSAPVRTASTSPIVGRRAADLRAPRRRARP